MFFDVRCAWGQDTHFGAATACSGFASLDPAALRASHPLHNGITRRKSRHSLSQLPQFFTLVTCLNMEPNIICFYFDQPVDLN
jgi:hypothetical protein